MQRFPYLICGFLLCCMKTALELFDTKRGGYCACHKKTERIYTTVTSTTVNIKKGAGFRLSYSLQCLQNCL